MKLQSLIFSLFIFTLTVADEGYTRYKNGDYIGMACSSAVVATFCKTTGKSSSCVCSNINALGSYVYCGYQQVNTTEDKTRFEKYFMGTCTNMTKDKMENAYRNVTNYLVDTSKLKSFNKTAVINYPVYYTKSVFENTYLSDKFRFQNFDRAMAWGSGLLGFWGLMVLIGGIDHWGSRFFPNYSLKLKKSVGQSGPMRLMRKHVTLPALFNGKHTTRNFFQGVIPTRYETIILTLFLALLVIGEATNIHFLPNDTIWKVKKVQLSRYVGDRSAVISLFLILPTYLFAGRNNFLLWVTGWKQSTFYTFHKWLARITVLTAFTHTIAMLLNSYWNVNIHKREYTYWWRWGSVAMVAGGIAFFQSMAIMRTKNYELFLYVHIILAALFLCGAWIHLSQFSYDEWAYAAAAIWCADRFMRIVRMATFGVKSAQVTLISDEILMLTMPHNFRRKFTPGSFGYVYFCKSWLFFQSHPFTVLEDDNGKIKFLVKVKNGVTKNLYHRLLKEPNQSCELKVAVEGFYGEYKPAFSYDQVVMIAGGNGIPGLYEYISDIAQKKAEGKSNTKFVKLYWVIRHWHSLDWFVDELIKLQQYDFVETVVYVTKYHDAKLGDRFAVADSSSSSIEITPEYIHEADEPKTESSPNEKDSTIESTDKSQCTWLDKVFKELPHVIFKDSRPNLPELIHTDIQEAGINDNVAIMTCAHNAMCDDVRKAVACEAGEPRGGRIELFELLQVW